MANDNEADPKIYLLEHSEAKINLYGTYLAIFLNILSRAKYVDKIFLFDLFCGEGIYRNGAKGSPIIALNAIRNHYFSNNQTCPNITVWFNDNGQSEINPEKSKIERVKELSIDIFTPKNVNVEYKKEDYEKIFPKAVNIVNRANRAKGLFFLDPYGYKAIKPEDIKVMLMGGNTEVLLWLPIAFMYRFANKALSEDFPGSDPLKEFLITLFGESVPEFKSSYEFIDQITNRFRSFLSNLNAYVDTFTLERDSTNIYCLFFFTCHIKGYETMLRAKWELDMYHGKGHKINRSPSFSEVQLSGYPQKLLDFIGSAEKRTNAEIYLFSLQNGFLPKHTNEVLSQLKKENHIEIEALDNKPVRGFYLEYKSKRQIEFKLRSKNQ